MLNINLFIDQVEIDLKSKIQQTLQDLQNENNPLQQSIHSLQLQKQMKDFKPQNFTIQEYDD